MATKNLKILSDQFKAYQEKANRGIYVDTHMEYVKVSPAEYTGSYVEPVTGQVIQKARVYQAIVEARNEARTLGISTPQLQIGLNTHNISFSIEQIGVVKSWKNNIHLEILDQGQVHLEAFKLLSSEYNGLKIFNIGRLPYHSDAVHQALTEVMNEHKHCKISSVFSRKRDNLPRVYLTMAFNDHVFNIKSSTDIHLDFDDDTETPTTPGSSSSVDL